MTKRITELTAISAITDTCVGVVVDAATTWKFTFAQVKTWLASLTVTFTNKTIDASANTITNITVAMFAASVIDPDGTLAANSDTRLATQKAVKTYADALIASQDAMVFKGVIDCSANPNYPAADRGWTYRISVAGKIGGASGLVVEAGDIMVCITDSTASGDQATVGTSWAVIQTNIDGAVITTRQINTGTGLTGGGDLSANRTLALATIADQRVMANVSGGALEPSATTLTALLDSIFGTTPGMRISRGASVWAASTAFAITDANLTIQDNVDATKQVVFELSSIGTGVTRTFTFPNLNGILACTNASQNWGNVQTITNTLTISSAALFLLPATTVASLPAATTAYQTRFVTDALAPTLGATVAGGGAVKTRVFSDGSNWIVG